MAVSELKKEKIEPLIVAMEEALKDFDIKVPRITWEIEDEERSEIATLRLAIGCARCGVSGALSTVIFLLPVAVCAPGDSRIPDLLKLAPSLIGESRRWYAAAHHVLTDLQKGMPSRGRVVGPRAPEVRGEAVPPGA